jgi:hypothetical protein
MLGEHQVDNGFLTHAISSYQSSTRDLIDSISIGLMRSSFHPQAMLWNFKLQGMNLSWKFQTILFSVGHISLARCSKFGSV